MGLMVKRVRKDNTIVVVIFVVVLVFLIGMSAYYIINQNSLGRRSNLVGDSVCGNIPEEDGQDFCCMKAHEDEAHARCVGSWKYLSGMATCQYVCSGVLPACQEDARVCPDGETVVVRNASNECEFNAC